MRKNLKSKVLLTLLAASVFYLPAYANAAEITIDDKLDYEAVADTWSHEKRFYHATSLEDNKITIDLSPDYASLLSDNPNIYGAFYDMTTANQKTIILKNNTIIIENGTFNNEYEFAGAFTDMYGAVSSEATLTGNSVTIKSGNFKDDLNIYGAYTNMYKLVEEEKNTQDNKATLSCNSVVINGGTFDGDDSGIYGASVYFGYSSEPTTNSATLTNNSVTISGGTFNGYDSYIYGASVYFGYSSEPTTNSATLTNNSVTISGAEFSGYSEICGAETWGDNTIAEDNTVTISGASFIKDFYKRLLYCYLRRLC